MERKQAQILRARDISEHAQTYAQRLNPRSRFRGTDLARTGGLERVGVSWVRLPPGNDSFAYHAHEINEEWMYVISGRPVALIDGHELALEAGDFVAFPAPQVPHLLMNRTGEDVVYLTGGERRNMDVLDYPAIGKRYLLRGEEGRAAFYPLDKPTFPFGEVDDE